MASGQDLTFKLGIDKREFTAGTAAAKKELSSLDGSQLSGLRKGLAEAKTELSAMGNTAKLVGGAVAAGTAAVGAATAGVVSVLSNLYSAHVKNQKITDDLDISLRRIGTTYAENKKHIEGFINSFRGVDDDEIKASLAGLVKSGYDLETAYRQIPLVLDIAARHFDGDILQATDLLTSVFNGNVRGMKALRLGFVETGDKVKDVANAMGALADSSKGAHELMLKHDPAKLLATTWGNLKDDLAEKVFPTIVKEIEKLQKSLDSVNIERLADGLTKLAELAGSVFTGLNKVYALFERRVAIEKEERGKKLQEEGLKEGNLKKVMEGLGIQKEAKEEFDLTTETLFPGRSKGAAKKSPAAQASVAVAAPSLAASPAVNQMQANQNAEDAKKAAEAAAKVQQAHQKKLDDAHARNRDFARGAMRGRPGASAFGNGAPAPKRPAPVAPGSTRMSDLDYTNNVVLKVYGLSPSHRVARSAV